MKSVLVMILMDINGECSMMSTVCCLCVLHEVLCYVILMKMNIQCTPYSAVSPYNCCRYSFKQWGLNQEGLKEFL